MKRKHLRLLSAILCGAGVTSATLVHAEENNYDSYFVDSALEQGQLLQEMLSTLKANYMTLETYVSMLSGQLEIDPEEAMHYISEHISTLKDSDHFTKDLIILLCQYKFQDTELPQGMGTNWSLEGYQNYLNTEEGQRQLQYCKMYGMDPHLLFALEKVESNLDHERYVGTYDDYGNYLYAVGITQQERSNFYNENATEEEIASKKPRTGYNYQTSQIDSIPLNEDLLDDFDTNVRLGIMELNNALNISDYDISYALDIYNKGKVGADRFRNDGIVSGNPNYVSDVYENLVVPYLTFQTDSDKITVIDMTNGKRYQCIIYPEISFDEFYEQYILFTNSLQQMESDEMTMSVQAGKVYQKRR